MYKKYKYKIISVNLGQKNIIILYMEIQSQPPPHIRLINPEDLQHHKDQLQRAKAIALANMGRHPVLYEPLSKRETVTLLKMVIDILDQKTDEEIIDEFNALITDEVWDSTNHKYQYDKMPIHNGCIRYPIEDNKEHLN